MHRLIVVLLVVAFASACRAEATFLCHFEFVGLKADCAKGGAEPVIGGGKVGPDGKWGWGLDARGRHELAYPTAGNISFDEGTMTMWVKPLWHPASERKIHCFWQTSANKWVDQMVRLTYWPYGGHAIRLEVRHGRTVALHADVTRWKRGEWHHLAWTWRRRPGERNDAIALYLDGKLAARSDEVSLPTRLGDRMFVGCNMNGTGRNEAAEAAMDEFYISSRAETEPPGLDSPCRVPSGTAGNLLPNFLAGLAGGRIWHGDDKLRFVLVNFERSPCEGTDVRFVLEPDERRIECPPPIRIENVPPGKRIERTISVRLNRGAEVWDRIKLGIRLRVRLEGGETQDRAAEAVLHVLPPEELELDEADRRVAWALPLPYRMNVVIDTSPFSGKWKRVAVQAVTAGRKMLADAFGIENSYVDMNSVRVVRYDPATGKPAAVDIPRRVENCVDGRYRVSWRVVPADGKMYFSIYFDLLDDDPHPPPDRLCLVGNGDRISFGRGKTCGWLGGGFHASADAADLDGDGDLDLVVNYLRGGHPNWTQGGLHLYYNVGTSRKPVFMHIAKIDELTPHPQLVDYDGDGVLDVVSGEGWRRNLGTNARPVLGPRQSFGKVKGLVTRVVDWDGDGKRDIIAGTSSRETYWPKGKWWGEPYPPFTPRGVWKGGPTVGHVWFYKNTGTDEKPEYADGVQLAVPDGAVLVYGKATPTVVDWDGDGDLDLICGEFLDAITFFENVGTRTRPKLTYGRPLTLGDEPTAIGCIICPVAVDFDRDGDYDLIVGGEDGHVTYIENVGGPKKPRLANERYLPQLAAPLKAGCLAVPVSCDWDDDGDMDIIAGDSYGFLDYFENVGTTAEPAYAPMVRLEAGGRTIRIQAGYNGSVQGPNEAKWGYTCPEAGDWDGDGLKDIITCSIWGHHILFRNIGEKGKPRLAEGKFIEVEWPSAEVPHPPWFWWRPVGKQLVTHWRSRPEMIDWNRDGLMDYVSIDHEGYMALYTRFRDGGGLKLRPGARVFLDEKGNPVRLNAKFGGSSGRRKIALVDWDGDGDRDIIANSSSAMWYENVGSDAKTKFIARGNLTPYVFTGHSTAPEPVDWDGDGKLDLLLGAEDGNLYYFHRSFIEDGVPRSVATSFERKP